MRCGLKKDDEILLFDGEKAQDMLDAAYFDSQSSFTVTVLRNGKTVTLQVDKPSEIPMGWDFYDECFIRPRWCANKCIFCFVDQLPKGQRETLYVKDDDWRLSFVSGNFVTLTNVSDSDVKRIVDKKFSPLYVSVHATEEDLRKRLLGNPKARDIMPLLKTFAQAGIYMFTQVVMCPGINDGAHLDRTLADLFTLFPYVRNVAVVTVGLTSHREGLCKLTPVSKEVACRTLDEVEKFDAKCFAQTGSHFAYCSDEMYLYAQREVPDYDYYGDFEQLENGVGLIADFRYLFGLAFDEATAAKKGSFTAVTGISAAPLIEQTIAKMKSKFPDLNADVLAVKNRFFGETVTVAGLLVGRDVADAVNNAKVGDTLLLPRVMLKETEDVFLDGMTLERLKEETGKNIIITADGYEFCRAVLECE